MKQYKKLLVAAALLAACSSTNAQDQQAKVRDGSPSEAVTGSVKVLHYISGMQRHYTVGSCVPGSDVQLYTHASGGAIAASAVADANGLARFTVEEGTPVAFAINHNAPNAQGISGTGKVTAIKQPALVIDGTEAVNFSGDIQVSWKAAVTEAGWIFAVQRSTDNKLFTDIATMDARQAKNMQAYTYTDKAADAGNLVYYRVEARRSSNSATTASAAVKMSGSAVFAVQPTLFTSQVMVSIPADKLPGTYTVTDITGRRKITGGIINTASQSIRLDVPAGTYALHITNSAGKSSAQLIVKQ